MRFLISKIANRKSEIKNRLRLKSSFGMSLIAVLWIVTILTVLASEFIYSMQLEMRIAKNWSDQLSAFYAAKGGLEAAMIMLKDDETEYDSLDEDWAEEITGELNDSTYTTILVDESARINVNTADEETLAKAIAYCLESSSDEEVLQEEAATQAQTLAAAIIEKRPFRTAAEMAKADDMTPELLYGKSVETTDADERAMEEETGEEEQIVPLVDITTVYSVDKNIASDGEARVNINSADANQIEQGVNREGESTLTGEEAQAIVDYRDELGGGQSGQGGTQNQGGQSNQALPQGEAGTAGGQSDQGGYQGIGQLLDVPAISQEELDAIRDSITVEDQGNQEGERRININTADAGELQNLEGVDEGIADSIIRYREQNRFDDVDELREVKAISLEDMRTIVDRVTVSDDEVLEGKVNINTAPLEILQMLPGLDEEKAQAIANRRGVEEGQDLTLMASQQGGQETGPFTSLGQLLDVDGIDEETFKNLVDHVTYRSYAYRIESEGRSSDGKIIQNCIAVVDRSGNRIKTKYWKQG